MGRGGGVRESGREWGESFQGLLLLFLMVAKATLTHEGHETLALEDHKYLSVTAFQLSYDHRSYERNLSNCV